MWCRRRVACGHLLGDWHLNRVEGPAWGESRGNRSDRANKMLCLSGPSVKRAGKQPADASTVSVRLQVPCLLSYAATVPIRLAECRRILPHPRQGPGNRIPPRRSAAAHKGIIFSRLRRSVPRLARGCGHGTVVATRPHLEFRTLHAAERRRARPLDGSRGSRVPAVIAADLLPGVGSPRLFLRNRAVRLHCAPCRSCGGRAASRCHTPLFLLVTRPLFSRECERHDYS